MTRIDFTYVGSFRELAKLSEKWRKAIQVEAAGGASAYFRPTEGGVVVSCGEEEFYMSTRGVVYFWRLTECCGRFSTLDSDSIYSGSPSHCPCGAPSSNAAIWKGRDASTQHFESFLEDWLSEATDPLTAAVEFPWVKKAVERVLNAKVLTPIQGSPAGDAWRRMLRSVDESGIIGS